MDPRDPGLPSDRQGGGGQIRKKTGRWVSEGREFGFKPLSFLSLLVRYFSLSGLLWLCAFLAFAIRTRAHFFFSPGPHFSIPPRGVLTRLFPDLAILSFDFPLRSVDCLWLLDSLPASHLHRRKTTPLLAQPNCGHNRINQPKKLRPNTNKHLALQAVMAGSAPVRTLNVQSFPRPPLVERCNRHIQIMWHGALIADCPAGDAYWVLETHHAPSPSTLSHFPRPSWLPSLPPLDIHPGLVEIRRSFLQPARPLGPVAGALHLGSNRASSRAVQWTFPIRVPPNRHFTFPIIPSHPVPLPSLHPPAVCEPNQNRSPTLTCSPQQRTTSHPAACACRSARRHARRTASSRAKPRTTRS